jgi:hypothetical protein
VSESIFASLDLSVLAYAAGMGATISTMHTWRARNAQRAQGLPLSGWLTLIPDTVLAVIMGAIFALGVPRFFPVFNTFSGVSLLAGGGALAGPWLWDQISTRAGPNLLDWLAGSGGPLAKLVASRQKDGDTDGNQPPPTPQ